MRSLMRFSRRFCSKSKKPAGREARRQEITSWQRDAMPRFTSDHAEAAIFFTMPMSPSRHATPPHSVVLHAEHTPVFFAGHAFNHAAEQCYEDDSADAATHFRHARNTAADICRTIFASMICPRSAARLERYDVSAIVCAFTLCRKKNICCASAERYEEFAAKRRQLPLFCQRQRAQMSAIPPERGERR